MGRPREHGQQTRSALLAAAASLLQREGRGAVSVRRVADEVGTTTRAVYSLFGDKESLLRELSVDVAETMRRHHESVPPSDDPLAEIVTLAFGYRAAALEKPNQYGLFVDEIHAGATLDDPIFALVYRSFDRVLLVIRRCLAQGLFPGRDEFTAGRFLLGIVHGLASLELRGVLGPPSRAEDVWRLSVTAALAGLQHPPPPAPAPPPASAAAPR